jgi:hypothetical protein
VPCTEPFQSVAHPCHILNTGGITGLTISVQKTKLMALTGRDPVRSKIVIDNKITGITNSMCRPQKTLKKTRIELYNTLAFPAVLHGSENWTIKTRDERRITAAEMKYIKKKSRIH